MKPALKLNIKYKMGLRAIKTAIAVFFCFLIAMIFNRADIFCSSIAAIICMQQTCNQTYKTGIDRFMGTIIGGILGYLLIKTSFMVPYYDTFAIVIVPAFILLAIYICNIIGRRDSIVIACIVITVVIVGRTTDTTDGTIIFVINRVIDTTIGVLVAMFVNKFFFPNKTLEKCSQENSQQ